MITVSVVFCPQQQQKNGAKVSLKWKFEIINRYRSQHTAYGSSLCELEKFKAEIIFLDVMRVEVALHQN